MARTSHPGGADGKAADDGCSHFLAAEIQSAESTSASDRWKPGSVTLYVVRITALGRREVWTVYRRYSKFYDLYIQLLKRFPNHTLPLIPPKKYIGKEDPQFIAQRRFELGEFLNALLRRPVEISLSEEVSLFLEVPEPLRLCFLETDARAPRLLPPLQGDAPKTIGPSGVELDESRVTWLLARLRDLPNNKVYSIRTFEDWILRTNPPLKEANAQMLYLGFERQGGLIEEVGAFEHSEVSAIAALGLLAKLLSHEHCNEASLFRQVLSRLDLSILVRMKLQHHIQRNRGQNNRLDAFRVLRSLELPSDKMIEMLQDDFALREFRGWLESLQSSLNFRTLHRAGETRGLPSIELSESPRQALSTKDYRKIAETAFTFVQMCLTTFALPSNEVGTSGGDTQPNYSPSSSALLARLPRSSSTILLYEGDMGMSTDMCADTGEGGGGSRDWGASGLSAVQDHSSWHRIPCPEPSWSTKYGLHAAYQHVSYEQQSDAYVVKVAMRIPFFAYHVACVLTDHAALIHEALKLKEAQLPAPALKRLKQLASGHLVSELLSSTTIRELQLGTPHEAFADLMECNLSTLAAPHELARLWLLRSMRIIPPRLEQAGSAVASPCMATCSVGNNRINESAQGAEEPRLRLDSNPELNALPSYLFLCTVVPPVAPPHRHTDSALPLNPEPAPPPPARPKRSEATPMQPPTPSSFPSAAAGGGSSGGVSTGSGCLGGIGQCGLSQVGEPRLVSFGVLLQQLSPVPAGTPAVDSSVGNSADESGVAPDGEPLCEVNLCAFLHREAVRLVSGDLLGERLLFWRTLENVFLILETLGELPADLEHPLKAAQERCLAASAFGTEQGLGFYGDSAVSGGSSTPKSQHSIVEVELVEGGQAFT